MPYKILCGLALSSRGTTPPQIVELMQGWIGTCRGLHDRYFQRHTTDGPQPTARIFDVLPGGRRAWETGTCRLMAYTGHSKGSLAVHHFRSQNGTSVPNLSQDTLESTSSTQPQCSRSISNKDRVGKVSCSYVRTRNEKILRSCVVEDPTDSLRSNVRT